MWGLLGEGQQDAQLERCEPLATDARRLSKLTDLSRWPGSRPWTQVEGVGSRLLLRVSSRANGFGHDSHKDLIVA